MPGADVGRMGRIGVVTLVLGRDLARPGPATNRVKKDAMTALQGTKDLLAVLNPIQ